MSIAQSDTQIAIISYKHNRIVFCHKEDYQARHTFTHLQVYYHDFTANGKLATRYIRLPMDSENDQWALYLEGGCLS